VLSYLFLKLNSKLIFILKLTNNIDIFINITYIMNNNINIIYVNIIYVNIIMIKILKLPTNIDP